MRSFMTLKPLSTPIPIPTTSVTRKAGRKAKPFRIARLNTTAARLIALPTERSM